MFIASLNKLNIQLANHKETEFHERVRMQLNLQ